MGRNSQFIIEEKVTAILDYIVWMCMYGFIGCTIGASEKEK